MTNDRAAAAFGALSDPTRVAIVSELAERAAASPASPAVGFADLRRAVGVDDSGRFRYHLNELRETFVRRTDDGYALTVAGRQVASVVAGGVFDGGTAEGPEPLGDDCPTCGDPLRVRYANGVVRVGCDGSTDTDGGRSADSDTTRDGADTNDARDDTRDDEGTNASRNDTRDGEETNGTRGETHDGENGDTGDDDRREDVGDGENPGEEAAGRGNEPTDEGHTVFVWTLPPSALADRPLTAAVPLAIRQSRRAISLATDGYCPECLGRVTPRAVETSASARFTASCRACSSHLDGRLASVVFADPAFAVFCRDRGYDQPPPSWRLDTTRLDDPGVPAGDYRTADGPVTAPVTTTPDDPLPDPDAVFARFAVSLDGDRFEARVGPTGRVLSTRTIENARDPNDDPDGPSDERSGHATDHDLDAPSDGRTVDVSNGHDSTADDPTPNVSDGE